MTEDLLFAASFALGFLCCMAFFLTLALIHKKRNHER